jgi:hypothetical protein
VHEAFFVFRGVHEPHRDQVEAVLERRGLAAVAETDPGVFGLLGAHSSGEGEVWAVLEARGTVTPAEVEALFRTAGERAALESLSARGLAFRSPDSGRLHALSRLVAHLM